jgi:hypothetical protein
MTDYTTPALNLLASAAIGVPILYLFHRFLARQPLKLNPYDIMLFMSGAFLIASIFEVALGSLHTQIFGWRMWEYRVLPNHGGYGSYLGPLFWPWYGFHLYLFHQVLQIRKRPLSKTTFLKGTCSGLDGPLLELLANGLFILFSGGFLFYYTPSDLGHLSSLSVMPHYVIGGVILAYVLKFLNNAKKNWALPAALFGTGLGFVFVG